MSAPVSRSLEVRTFPIIFAAPSGAGKTTIAQRLMERRGDIVFSISMTTRSPRSYERNGVHYHFVAEDEFRRLADAGELVEWAEVHGHLYGTPARNLSESVERRQYLILDIDIQGARQIRRAVPEAVSIFVLPPSGVELGQRLAGRGSEDGAVRRRRLGNARAEIQAAGEFDYVIVNESLDTSVAAVEAILLAEGCRTSRLPGLTQEIGRLDDEIEQCLREFGSPPASSSDPQ